MLNDGHRNQLLILARTTIECAFDGCFDAPDPALVDEALHRPAGAFVTLRTAAGDLRGCIGSIHPREALYRAVVSGALSAAFRDPRFPAVTAAEWPQCRVEVSLLSRAKPMRVADEAELLAQIQPGEDGLILECDGRRGTFLPQVWESIPDKKAFLNELLRKAGLPADTRLGRCRISRYRVAKWKE